MPKKAGKLNTKKITDEAFNTLVTRLNLFVKTREESFLNTMNSQLKYILREAPNPPAQKIIKAILFHKNECALHILRSHLKTFKDYELMKLYGGPILPLIFQANLPAPIQLQVLQEYVFLLKRISIPGFSSLSHFQVRNHLLDSGILRTIHQSTDPTFIVHYQTFLEEAHKSSLLTKEELEQTFALFKEHPHHKKTGTLSELKEIKIDESKSQSTPTSTSLVLNDLATMQSSTSSVNSIKPRVSETMLKPSGTSSPIPMPQVLQTNLRKPSVTSNVIPMQRLQTKLSEPSAQQQMTASVSLEKTREFAPLAMPSQQSQQSQQHTFHRFIPPIAAPHWPVKQHHPQSLFMFAPRNNLEPLPVYDDMRASSLQEAIAASEDKLIIKKNILNQSYAAYDHRRAAYLQEVITVIENELILKKHIFNLLDTAFDTPEQSHSAPTMHLGKK